jgi:hypothetical protein
MSKFSHWVEHFPKSSFGFACCASVKDTSGWHRCGKTSHSVLHVGGNDVQIVYCEKHMKDFIREEQEDKVLDKLDAA